MEVEAEVEEVVLLWEPGQAVVAVLLDLAGLAHEPMPWVRVVVLRQA